MTKVYSTHSGNIIPEISSIDFKVHEGAASSITYGEGIHHCRHYDRSKSELICFHPIVSKYGYLGQIMNENGLTFPSSHSGLAKGPELTLVKEDGLAIMPYFTPLTEQDAGYIPVEMKIVSI